MNTNSFQESYALLNELLAEMGIDALPEHVAKRDWGVSGGETQSQLFEWASDYASELQTERCAEKNAWRYQY